MKKSPRLVLAGRFVTELFFISQLEFRPEWAKVVAYLRDCSLTRDVCSYRTIAQDHAQVEAFLTHDQLTNFARMFHSP
jgi:hypothetical protein